MSVMDTGFVSADQEKYLMMNEPSLYKAVLKKHGSFIKAKKRPQNTPSTTPNTPPRGRGRSK